MREKAKKLINIGFNCMPINENKTPIRRWSAYQDTKITSLDDFEADSDYYALITGFNDVECIDIDLKVITDFEQRKNFKKDLFNMLSDNIEDFYKKVVIKKTRSGGYHVIYQAKNLFGNKKLATLAGMKEAVIETRGIGGYICMYNNVLFERDYDSISYVTEFERDAIISCCRTFNEPDQTISQAVDKKTAKQYSDNDLTPWRDYNERTNIWNLISTEFSVVRKTHDKTIIRRNGAKSPHSGYIYGNSNCLYLFSTGTAYPAEQLLSPYNVYTIQSHHGNFSQSASELYRQGYGARRKPILRENIVNKTAEKIKKTSIDFPIEIFPREIQTYIFESSTTLNMSIDFMGCAFLWAMSLVIGNSFVIEIKRGWREICSVWISIVGEAGVGKTPALSQMTGPLFKINSRKIKEYQDDLKQYNDFNDLDNKEKATVPNVEKPVRQQFIVDDVTIEALINLHAQSKNAVGVFKDELAGWFKDMNKYKAGSDKEQWLSSWSGRGIYVDRITRQSDYIPAPFMPVLGGIQPTILATFFTDENKDNGFLDRMLFSFPNVKIGEYTDKEISAELLNYYSDWVLTTQTSITKFTKYNDDGDIEPNICKFSPAAKKEWIRIFNEITALQNSESTDELIKSMLAKQKGYIPRFALILNIVNFEQIPDQLIIERESVLAAKKLSDYFIENYKKMIVINSEVSDTNKILNDTKGNKFDKLKAIYSDNPSFNRTEIAKKFNISRKTLYNYIEQIENSEKQEKTRKSV